VDLTSNQVIKTISVPGYPEAGCYSEFADKYYCGGDDAVTVVCGAGDTVVAQIPFEQGSLVRTMATVESHGLVVVAMWYTSGTDGYNLYALRTRDDSIVSVLPTGREPEGLFWSPTTDLVYCSNCLSRSVTVFQGDASREVATLAVGVCPYVFAASPDRRRVYVGHLSGRYVYVIRDTITGIAEERPVAEVHPAALRAWPNPFSGHVRMSSSDVSDRAAVLVYAADGRQVAKLEAQEGRGGGAEYDWNGKDMNGKEVSAGVYMAKLEHCVLPTETRLVKAR
jgi:DNA-binding beta-propeller fold protein YncE